jgi:hypothetical protein
LVADGHALPDKRPTVSRLNIKKVLDARYRGTVEKDGWRAALYARYLEESL